MRKPLSSATSEDPARMDRAEDGAAHANLGSRWRRLILHGSRGAHCVNNSTGLARSGHPGPSCHRSRPSAVSSRCPMRCSVPTGASTPERRRHDRRGLSISRTQPFTQTERPDATIPPALEICHRDKASSSTLPRPNGRARLSAPRRWTSALPASAFVAQTVPWVTRVDTDLLPRGHSLSHHSFSFQ
jgi:hypothetical protein